MDTKYPTAGPDSDINEIATRMVEKDHEYILVVDDGTLIGVYYPGRHRPGISEGRGFRLSFRPTYAGISLPAVADNIRLLRSRLRPSTLFMAVVKSDAYGHGDLEVSRGPRGRGVPPGSGPGGGGGTSAGSGHLGAHPPALRASPPGGGTSGGTGAGPPVYSRAYAEELSRQAKRVGKLVPIHLKLDTGMHRVRYGEPASCADEAAYIGGLPPWRRRVSIPTSPWLRT